MSIVWWLCSIILGIAVFLVVSMIIFLTIDDPKRRIDAGED